MTDQQIQEAAHLDAAGNALYANHKMAFIRGAEFARPKWIPVSEGLPEPGEEVIVLQGRYIGTDIFNGSDTWKDWLFSGNPSEITHWMPLPNYFPPAPGQEAGKP